MNGHWIILLRIVADGDVITGESVGTVIESRSFQVLQ